MGIPYENRHITEVIITLKGTELPKVVITELLMDEDNQFGEVEQSFELSML